MRSGRTSGKNPSLVPEIAVLLGMNLLQPISSASAKGQRPYQEDRYLVSSLPQGTLLAVFDGHGGSETAQFAYKRIAKIFADNIAAEHTAAAHLADVDAADLAKVEASDLAAAALEKTILSLNISTQHMGPGSTLSVVFIPTNGDVAVCAVLGDSPIIIKDADGKINISPEHNVRTNDQERKAAEARGGYVSGGYLFESYHGMGLQMARALGDVHLNKVLSRIPDIYEVKLSAKSFVIVATDGAFDPGHYEFEKAAEAVVQLVEGGADAQAVVDRALKIETGDNVSCIVARFREENVN